VLVVSGVEGVQPQTRVLMRALRRLRIPTLLFVNKLDRAGADFDRVVRDIAERLTPAVVVPGRDVEILAEHDDELLAAYVDGGVSPERAHAALVEQTRRALVFPVFGGSAMRGEGIDELSVALGELLPSADGDADGPLSATVFKIERSAEGEKVAYVRLFSGALHTRETIDEQKVTALAVFERGGATRRPSVGARQIAKVWGLREVKVGDTLGRPPERMPRREFAPPTLQSVVAPQDPGDARRLRLALAQLAEQDPLIDVRDEAGRELTVSLYGEVQKEVIEATLAQEFGVAAVFHETTPICVERPVRVGEALEVLHAETNPYNATMGLRLEPAPDDSGLEFRLDVDTRNVPLYVYKTRDSFREQMERYVREALRHGLSGWHVVDCVVTMTQCAYSVADGPPSLRGPTSTAADFRKLTPLVLAQALERAGTVICEPVVRLALEVPTRSLGAVLPALARLGAAVETPVPHGELSAVEALLPVTRADELQRQLAGLTGGEGIAETTFAGYKPVGL
jgi:ribosomal protection tetracycline resistance protein